MPINEVIASMKSLCDLHRVMVDVAEAKKRYIIKNKVDDLTKLLTQEARGIKMIDEEERRLSDAVTRFLFALGIHLQGRMSISELSKLVKDPQQKQELLDYRIKLNQLIVQLKEQNELIRCMVQESMKYINFSIDLMIGSSDADYIYTKPADQSKEPAKRGVYNYHA